jgi:hypothetical protein
MSFGFYPHSSERNAIATLAMQGLINRPDVKFEDVGKLAAQAADAILAGQATDDAETSEAVAAESSPRATFQQYHDLGLAAMRLRTAIQTLEGTGLVPAARLQALKRELQELNKTIANAPLDEV